VFILDFSFPRAILEDLVSQQHEVLVIDHHKSAMAALEGFPHAIFDMTKSGAVLSWEYFHPDKPVPLLLKYIQDRDLWIWQLGYSKEISAGLASHPFDFNLWNEFAKEPPEEVIFSQYKMSCLLTDGTALLRQQDKTVKTLSSKPIWVSIPAIEGVGFYDIPAVNATVFISEVAHQLCKDYPDKPFAACYFYKDGREIWSLRSIGDFDVSLIAKEFGGGGHRNAAGFSLPQGRIPSWLGEES
jgi:oligoribonuclease NrnB/cAMP/cGMP phosphodiesterase (DHH superfamily)